jgi:diazepam-binding inhibitor (GABA receptor modulator, acyl-CoA-binding protein)
MALKDDFEKAAQDVQKLPQRPDNDTLLQLYSLYKQATEGDVNGSRPGMLDIKGRKKFDAWAAVKGTSSQAAMERYVALVKKLQG